jgi:sugar phosphate isomerase/epimerase
MHLNRRQLVAGAAAVVASAATPSALRAAAPVLRAGEPAPLYPKRNLPFAIAVINDEIGQDFDHVCQIVANEFGLQQIELRSMWDKNVSELDDQQIGEAKRILAKYNLTVCDIASPLFKTDFPGAKVQPGTKVDQFGGAASYAQQNEVMERCIHMARAFSTTQIRCFDYTRLAEDDRKRLMPDIYEQLRKASAVLAKDNLVLLLENEQSCNTATGPEAAATMAAVRNTNFMLNWDPGNAAWMGTVPYPKGYDLLPKNRIGHVHCKDVVKQADGKPAWAAVGSGVVDWHGQIEALVKQRFHYTMSLETHWRGAGTPEASTRISMAGLQKILAEVSA